MPGWGGVRTMHPQKTVRQTPTSKLKPGSYSIPPPCNNYFSLPRAVTTLITGTLQSTAWCSAVAGTISPGYTSALFAVMQSCHKK